MSIRNILAVDQFKTDLKLSGSNLLFAHFTGEWVQEHTKQINAVIEELIKEKTPQSSLIQIDVDKVPELAKSYDIKALPTVLLIAKSDLVGKVEGINIPLLVKKTDEAIMKHFPLNAHFDEPIQLSNQKKLEDRLKGLIGKAPLMIFIKGQRDAPRCGFSKQLVELLNSINADYESFDILSDEEVRQGLKSYSNWPTYPQVYYKNELIGGIDIIKEMFKTGEFQNMLKN